jgi:hypothetical protein
MRNREKGMDNKLIARLRTRIAVIDAYVSEPGNLPRKLVDERTLLSDAIAALSRPMTNDNKPSAAPGLEVVQEFDFEAWLEANTYSRDSAPKDCYYIKESAVRELWDRQQRAAPVLVDARLEELLKSALLVTYSDAVDGVDLRLDAKSVEALRAYVNTLRQPKPEADKAVADLQEALTRCAAGRDGDCIHPKCPQNREGEPMKTGRHCPLDTDDEDGL